MGLTYHLIRNKGGEEGHLQENKWLLGKINGSLVNSWKIWSFFCDNVSLGVISIFPLFSLVIGVNLPRFWNSGERISNNWVLLRGSAFRQVREFRGEKSILKCLQFKIIFMPQWCILDPFTINTYSVHSTELVGKIKFFRAKFSHQGAYKISWAIRQLKLSIFCFLILLQQQKEFSYIMNKNKKWQILKNAIKELIPIPQKKKRVPTNE